MPLFVQKLVHGKQVGNDIAGATHEDEVIRSSILESLMIGLGDAATIEPMKMMLITHGSNTLGRDGSLRRGLAPVVDGILGQEGHDGGYILVVDHSKDDAPMKAGHGGYLRRQILPSTNIVTSVADDKRMLVELLPATREPRELGDLGYTFIYIVDG